MSHTFVATAFTTDKKSLCDIKFVKWLVRKNRDLSGDGIEGVFTAGKQHDGLKKKDHGQDTGNHIEGINEYPCYCQIIVILIPLSE